MRVAVSEWRGSWGNATSGIFSRTAEVALVVVRLSQLVVGVSEHLRDAVAVCLLESSVERVGAAKILNSYRVSAVVVGVETRLVRLGEGAHSIGMVGRV